VPALRRLIVALIVFYGAVLALFSHDGFPTAPRSTAALPYLADKPLGEDGYYMLTVAWRLAGSGTFTYNGDIATTGVQPLVTVLAAMLAAVVRVLGGDEWDFARAMLFAGVLQHVGLFLALSTLVRRLTPPDASAGTIQNLTLVTGALVMLNYGLFRMSTYGLETTLYLIVLALAVSVTVNAQNWTSRTAIGFGVLCGCATLARVDFLVIFGVFIATNVVLRRMPLRGAVLASAAASVVAAPWFIWVYSATGHIIPSGGRAQATLISLSSLDARLVPMAEALAQHSSPLVYLPALTAALNQLVPSSMLTAKIGCELALAVVGIHFALRGWRIVRRDAAFVILAWLAAFAILSCIYVLLFWSTHFYLRYTAPLLVLVLPLMALGLWEWLEMKRMAQTFVAAAAISFAITAYVTLHQGRVGNLHSITAGFVRTELPPSSQVGALQSGVIGYYNPNVINLDGKVNAEAIDATTNGGLVQYIRERNITYLIDWPEVIVDAVGESYVAKTRRCAVQPPAGRSVCVVVAAD
jgi:hypothetical protein